MKDGGLPRRILIVEDEEDVRTLVSAVLEDAGYEVVLARDGWEGIECLASHRPHLVILDLLLPDVLGFQVLEHIQGTAAPPPVVLLTVCGDYESFSRGLRGGASAYLFKPFRIEALLETIDLLLRPDRRPIPGTTPERRREQRRPLRLDLRSLAGGREDVVFGSLVDLSPGGLQVELCAPRSPGEFVRLALHIPSGELALDLGARVRWAHAAEGRFAHGVAFEGLGAGPRGKLRALLEVPGGPRRPTSAT